MWQLEPPLWECAACIFYLKVSALLGSTLLAFLCFFFLLPTLSFLYLLLFFSLLSLHFKSRHAWRVQLLMPHFSLCTTHLEKKSSPDPQVLPSHSQWRLPTMKASSSRVQTCVFHSIFEQRFSKSFYLLYFLWPPTLFRKERTLELLTTFTFLHVHFWLLSS